MGASASFLLKGEQINVIEGTSSGFKNSTACGAREPVNNTVGRVGAVASTQLPPVSAVPTVAQQEGGPGLAEPLNFQAK